MKRHQLYACIREPKSVGLLVRRVKRRKQGVDPRAWVAARRYGVFLAHIPHLDRMIEQHRVFRHSETLRHFRFKLGEYLLRRCKRCRVKRQ